jgi:very-short-patch-repair endonuclease
VDFDALRQAAEGQHRLLLTRRLAGLGLASGQVHRLRQEGWLSDVRPGVVLVGGGEPTEWQRVVAVSLLAGPNAAISHRTAARIHRFAGVAPADGHGAAPEVEVSVARPAHPRIGGGGCSLHRVCHLPEEDVTRHRGIRVTSPARTLVDVLPTLTPPVLEKTLDEGIVAGSWDSRQLAAVAERAAGRRGVDSLRRLLHLRLELPATDSPLEERAVRALMSLGLFETRYQVVLEGQLCLLDIAWPAYRVAAECDGWAVRSRSRGKFDHERRRNNLLASHGWSIVHLTSAMSEDEMRAAVVKVLLRAAAG